MRKGLLSSAFFALALPGIASAQTADSARPAPLVIDGGIKNPSTPAPASTPALTAMPAPMPSDGREVITPQAGCMTTMDVESTSSGSRFWASSEYLLWWMKNGNVPPLLTASPAGAMGAGASVILGNGGDLDAGPFSGGRFRAGYWFDRDQTLGVESDFFFLGAKSADFTAAGSGAPGSPVLARPFFNVLSGAPDAELVTFPGALAGAFTASRSSRLYGFEDNVVTTIRQNCSSRWELFGGFRYLNLNENLQIGEQLEVAPTIPNIGGNTFHLVDQFDTRNQFYGGQLGARGEYHFGKMFVQARASVALGDTHEVVTEAGSTQVTFPGGGSTLLRGGLLVQTSNAGTTSRDRFGVVPEIGLNIGYQVTESMRVYAGYTFLYWDDVARPGDQIDLAVNPSLIPSLVGAPAAFGPARPAVEHKEVDFWAQGVNFGLEFRF